MTYPRSLSDSDRSSLRNWTAPSFTLPVHRELEHQMRLGMEGVESALVLGDYGTGKTCSCRRIAAAIEDAELRLSYDDPSYVPRRILMYESSTADGRKTALVDLCELTSNEELSFSARRSHTPTHLVGRIAELCRVRSIHLIVVDEAGKINENNLDMVRQIPDAARRIAHPMALIYVGTPELRALMAKTGQLGQRVSAEVHLERLTLSSLLTLMDGWHPHLQPLRAHLGEQAWRTLVERVRSKCGGSVRRIDTVVANAHHLALVLRRWIDEEILGMALDKLADEA